MRAISLYCATVSTPSIFTQRSDSLTPCIHFICFHWNSTYSRPLGIRFSQLCCSFWRRTINTQQNNIFRVDAIYSNINEFAAWVDLVLFACVLFVSVAECQQYMKWCDFTSSMVSVYLSHGIANVEVCVRPARNGTTETTINRGHRWRSRQQYYYLYSHAKCVRN